MAIAFPVTFMSGGLFEKFEWYLLASIKRIKNEVKNYQPILLFHLVSEIIRTNKIKKKQITEKQNDVIAAMFSLYLMTRMLF